MTYEILAKYGHNDIIYKWLHSPKGFSQMLLNDETTLKEFSGDNSKGSENHAMFSSYVQWFYQGLGGINILDDSFGADNILIKPYFEEKINYVKSQYESVKGSIVSNWVRENGVINMHLEIPQNLKKCSLGIENRYKDCVKDYPLYETDENYIYVDISSYNGIIDLKLG
jgi:alpha-L-rhamnosidase